VGDRRAAAVAAASAVATGLATGGFTA
jgi:hypothetical protein